jgi:uncharacterized protein (TIGR03435 family)
MHSLQKLRNSLFVTVTAAISLAAFADGQSNSAPPQSSPDKLLAFDVVSVKPHALGDRTMSFGPSPVGYHGVNIAASFLIQYAWSLALADQISGLPGWASDAPFDVEAKMDDETLAEFRKLTPEQRQQQRRLMMQAVLADRFGLKVHPEVKDQPIYELVVAKGGSKFEASPPDEPQRVMTGSGRIVLQAIPLVNVADYLPTETGRIVVDKTGLTGNYDLTLQWIPGGRRARQTTQGRRSSPKNNLALSSSQPRVPSTQSSSTTSNRQRRNKAARVRNRGQPFCFGIPFASADSPPAPRTPFRDICRVGAAK